MTEESKVIEVPAFGAPMPECDPRLLEMGRFAYEVGSPNWTISLLQSARLLNFAENPVDPWCAGCYVDARILSWIMASIADSEATADIDRCIFFSQNTIEVKAFLDYVDIPKLNVVENIAKELLSTFKKEPYAKKFLVQCSTSYIDKEGKRAGGHATTLVFTKDDTDSKKILVSIIDSDTALNDGNPEGDLIMSKLMEILSNIPKMADWKLEKFAEDCIPIQAYEKGIRASHGTDKNKTEPGGYCETWRLITLVIMALLGDPKVTPKEIYADIVGSPVKIEGLVRTVSICAVINSFKYGKASTLFTGAYYCCPKLPTSVGTASP